MALVEQLGNGGRWYVQLAAIWHWYLAFICRGAGWGVREAGWKHE